MFPSLHCVIVSGHLHSAVIVVFAVTVTLTVAVLPVNWQDEESFVISMPFLLIFDITQFAGAEKVNVTYDPENTF